MSIKQLYENKIEDGLKIKFTARVRSNRTGKNVSFLVVNDGSTIKDLQLVYKNDFYKFEETQKVRTGSVITFSGVLKLTPNSSQPFEVLLNDISFDSLTSENFILQKKEHSYEFLREIAHLRVQTKTFQTIFRIRSAISYAIHNFFNNNNYIYMHSPIITSNDAEGAGESFNVITENNNNNIYDFFGKKANLTVSGQLHAESFVQAFKKVYTFGPTFRAEKSNTTKHAAEFWMIEAEIADYKLDNLIVNMESLIKFVINYVIDNNIEDLKYCDENLENGLIEKLKNTVNNNFEKIEYSKAIDILNKAVKDGFNFEQKEINFGTDLGTEHERYLCEEHFKKPTFLINYPKEIKAFYMKQNEDNKTVAAVDLLVPKIGELIGGSQREDSYDKLITRCNEMKIDTNDLEWYLNLRKEGYYYSSGYGLGFDRLLIYITGVSNIRDAQPFPRTPNNLLY